MEGQDAAKAMIIRAMKTEDIPKIEAIYARSPAKYDVPMLDSPNLLTSLVMVDDDDEPHALLAGEMVAEMFLVIDHEWETPAYRAIALNELAKAVVPQLEARGIHSAYAFLGPDIPTGYDKRLYRLGARIMTWRCVKWIKGGK